MEATQFKDTYCSKLASKLQIEAGEAFGQTELFPNLVDFNELLLNKQNKSFVAKINGDKYHNFGIYNNDIIVLYMHYKAKDGDLVLVQIHNFLAIKKIKIMENEMYLCDANNVFMPMQIEELNYKIIGKITQVIHNI